MISYRDSVHDELGRLERAQKAGVVLADLKVTHSPACNRPLEAPPTNSDYCHLCRRPFGTSPPGQARLDRLEFEMEQLKATLAEANEMVASLQAESERLSAELASDLGRIQSACVVTGSWSGY